MHFVVLKEYPFLSNGKVNRKALPLPQIGIFNIQFVSFFSFFTIYLESTNSSEKIITFESSTVEHKIREIWTQLGLHVTKNDQNFYEAGGSSLSAMQFFYPSVILSNFIFHGFLEKPL